MFQLPLTFLGWPGQTSPSGPPDPRADFLPVLLQQTEKSGCCGGWDGAPKMRRKIQNYPPSLAFKLNFRWYPQRNSAYDLVVSLQVISIWVFALLIFRVFRLPLQHNYPKIRAILVHLCFEILAIEEFDSAVPRPMAVLRFLGVAVISAASSCAKAEGNDHWNPSRLGIPVA